MFWQNKVVFLTGASSGIGEALAVEISKRGAKVGMLARREELLKQISDKIEQTGGKARCFSADVTDATAVAKAAQNLRTSSEN